MEDTAENLKGLERRAAGFSGGNDSLEGMKQRERSGFYSGTGIDPKAVALRKIKKRGPLGVILAVLIFAVGSLLFGQFTLPFSLVEQIKTVYDSMRTVTNKRADVFLRHQLNPGRVKDPVVAKIFSGSNFRISKKQEKKLAKQGIEVDRDYDGKGVTVLKMKTDGKEIIVVPDVKSREKLGLGKNALTFAEAFSDNSDFRNGYIRGSRTWRGSVAAWFDKKAVQFLESNAITRNRFLDFQRRVKEEHGGDELKALKKGLRANAFDGGPEISNAYDKNKSKKVLVKDKDENPVLDKDGKEQYEELTKSLSESEGNGTEGIKIGAGIKDSKTEFDGKLGGIKQKIDELKIDGEGYKEVTKTANIACTVYNVVSSVNMMLTAHVTMQVLQLTSGYLEGIQKAQAGHGSDSPINLLSNKLMQNVENLGDDGKVLSKKSAMESQAMVSIYSRRPINKNDAGIKRMDKTLKITDSKSGLIQGLAGVSMKPEDFKKCSMVSFGNAALGFAGDFIGIVAEAVSGASLVGKISSLVLGLAVSAAVGVIVSGVISSISASAFEIMKRDFVEKLGGEDLGNVLGGAGSGLYMRENHRSGGGALANEEGVLKYALADQEVLAEEARFERETRSPFDISSPHTFMGSIMFSLVPVRAQLSSVSGIMSGTFRTLGTAVGSLLPSAKAVEATNLISGKGDCPELEEIGAIGDVFCNPYIVSDLSTIDDSAENDPAEIADKVYKLGGLEVDSGDDENRVATIKPNSNLAKYILFCSGRSSPFGVTDQNIAGQFKSIGEVETGNGTLNTAINGIIGAVPILGDVIDLAQSVSAMENHRWISGEACVQKPGNKNGTGTGLIDKAPDWSEMKYYQRFVEDQRLVEAFGIGESAVTKFIAEYNAKHPVSNSYESMLARRAGMTEKNLLALVEVMEEAREIARYNPNERLWFGQKAEPVKMKFKQFWAKTEAAVLSFGTVFKDLRMVEIV